MTIADKGAKASKQNRVIAFVEFCGKHPFATGLFALLGVVGFLFSVWATLQSNKDTESIQRTVGDVQAAVQAACRYPPCWTPDQAVTQLLGSTKDQVDGKVGPPGSRTASGWHYKVQACSITVHFVNDVVAYFSHPLSTHCPTAWQDAFSISKAMPPPERMTIGHMLDGMFSDAHPPQLHIATGCTTCGNWHEPYIEFRVPGAHASDFFDRYFSTRFDGVDGADDQFENRLTTDTSLDASGTMTEFCEVDVRNIAAATLRDVRITDVGYGKGGWHGRENYPIDVCHQGYVAGPP
jgi:hypothetical protein